MTSRSSAAKRPHEAKILEQYFYDLYGVFMKKLSSFVLESETTEAEIIKMQQLLSEMIKIKKLMSPK